MAVQDFAIVSLPPSLIIMTTFKFNFAVDDTDVDPDFAIPEELARVRLSDANTGEAHPKPEWEHRRAFVELAVDEL